MENTQFSQTLMIIKSCCSKLAKIDKALDSSLLEEHHIAEYEKERTIIENQLERAVLSYQSLSAEF